MSETKSSQPEGNHPETVVQLQDVIRRIEQVMSHAWMVRTFIKHSDEIDDFPELMGIVRAVFDTARALETRVDDPASFLKMLSKKIGKLRKASTQFRKDALLASTHTNFQQAVHSIDACCEQLQELLNQGNELLE